ncbi:MULTISPECIES: hypothetical protein [unclassified Nonomuraea]|nr:MULTISPECIES: hypothetical protein [unclassified Nonomuraea]NBE96202.1 hypothetical protein [Nonomuraea sp. K271]
MIDQPNPDDERELEARCARFRIAKQELDRAARRQGETEEEDEADSAA